MRLVPEPVYLLVELVAVLAAEMEPVVGCTRRESKRSYQMGWNFVAGTTVVDSGSFAAGSGSFEQGSGSGLGNQIDFAKGLLTGKLELDFVVVVALVVVATMD